QRLFGYDQLTAAIRLEEFRTGLARTPVTNAHWGLVSTKYERAGFDKEAYEHDRWRLSRAKQVSPRPPARAPAPAPAPAAKVPAPTFAPRGVSFLVKLEGPSEDSDLAEAFGSQTDLKVLGQDASGESKGFCVVNQDARQAIFAWICATDGSFNPTFLPYSMARKELSATSIAPTLGVDASLPQHRINGPDDWRLRPRQDEYPVKYFLYGTFADPTVLRRLLILIQDKYKNLDDMYVKSRVLGGKLVTWDGKYEGLVDSEGDFVWGWSFEVEDRDQEDALRCYETGRYEVVRCIAQIGGPTRLSRALTFRFVTE
ncbi:hypothetical protein B0H67DRAFT_666587, partial [Lasiosphaeris hirsuta]